MATLQHNLKTGARGIQWCDATLNPVGGCLHDCKWTMPDGTIAHCYAKDVAERGPAAGNYKQGFAAHYWRPNALREMAAAGPPQLIFIDSMSDLMGHWVPEDQVRTVLQTMPAGGHNVFQMLTKNPRRYLKFLDDLPFNGWVGASSAPNFMMGRELTPHQQERYMHVALETLTAVRERTGRIVWMSIEPLSWDVAGIISQYPALDWVIVGAASSGRKYFQPDARHVDRLLDALDAQGAAVFFKGNIAGLFDAYDFGSEAKNRWREDFPVRPVPGSPYDGPAPAVAPAPAVVRRQRLARQHGWTLNTFLPETAAAAEPEARTAGATAARPAQPSLFG